jgi:flavin-binding protein dodecin
VSIEKSIDLAATGATIEDAVASAVDRASLTVRGLRSFEVVSIDGEIENGEPSYRAVVRIWFEIKERVHE